MAQPDAAIPEDLAHADIGIVHALPMELEPFWKKCSRLRTYQAHRMKVRGGRYDAVRVAFMESGTGFARARHATQALISTHSPNWVISAGFSGGLTAATKVGDIVVASSLIDTHGQEFQIDLKMPANPAGGLHVGKLLTSDHIVRTIVEKQALAEQYQALAVDLESLAVAQVCREMKTRFLAVRVISDDLSADLPPEVLSILGATGNVRWGATLGAIWKRPGSVSDLWSLKEKAQQAAQKLATFLDGVVVQLHSAPTPQPATPPS